MSIAKVLLYFNACYVLPVLLFISTPGVYADELEKLGRLFTDTGQRQKLDAIRRGTYTEESEQSSAASNVRVNGIMMRSNGDNVVWVNGESTLDNRVSEGVKINPKAADKESYSVPLRINGKRIKIKPGQNWSEGTDQIKDNY